MTNKLTVSHTEMGHSGAKQDTLTAQMRLWKFMSGHTARYVSGESSSVPQETADELLASALYTMGLTPEDPELWAHLPENLDEAYRAGVRRLERKTALGCGLCAAALKSVPALPCRSLTDTLKSIHRGFGSYDFRWFAREFPADIDYQLCLSVPETLLGVDYVNEYLRRILFENDFLRRLDATTSAKLLSRISPNWRALVCNLYEPVASGVLGAALTKRDVRKMQTDLPVLQALLEILPRSQMEEELRLAAEKAADALNIDHPAAKQYITRTALALVPRISAALDAGNLDGVFPQF